MLKVVPSFHLLDVNGKPHGVDKKDAGLSHLERIRQFYWAVFYCSSLRRMRHWGLPFALVQKRSTFPSFSSSGFARSIAFRV